VNVYVFTGPTISAAEACQELDAVYLPPAAEGDVFRVTLRRPQAIGIIDGYFHSVPTVRHKEILWAMSQGIHVFGSASIGALRAVELAAFGMEGIGRIFESYRDGILEDDDEVAVAHGPSEVGFIAGSEAMVNIRCTLQKAELDGIISAEARTALENIAKDCFYPDRSYPSLFRCASDRGLSNGDLAGLRQWLPEGRVNQKREDALAMLQLIRKRLKDGLKPKSVSYSFQHTVMWEATRRQSGELRFDSNAEPSAIVLESLLDELRLKGDQYKQHNLLALGRYLAIREARRLGVVVNERHRKQAESAFRRERNLFDDDELQRWLSDNGLSRDDFDALMIDEAHLSWFDQGGQSISVACLPNQLRLSGDYARLLERASAKDRLLKSLGLTNLSVRNTNLTESELLQWYFAEVLGGCVPSDPSTSWRKLGFANADAFRRALSKEYLFRQFKDKHATDWKNTERRLGS
jgi:hypothetical protein